MRKSNEYAYPPSESNNDVCNFHWWLHAHLPRTCLKAAYLIQSSTINIRMTSNGCCMLHGIEKKVWKVSYKCVLQSITHRSIMLLIKEVQDEYISLANYHLPILTQYPMITVVEGYSNWLNLFKTFQYIFGIFNTFHHTINCFRRRSNFLVQ